MPKKQQDHGHVVSVRLPHELLQRLDRYLDWRAGARQGNASRNAALREALSSWLDAQEQRAGFLAPHAQRQQFRAAYQSIAHGHAWAAIHQLRPLLPWPRERFDAVVEGLRAEHHVELERAEPGALSEQALHSSYQVHGQLYSRLRWGH